jgi:hypothetical protein
MFKLRDEELNLLTLAPSASANLANTEAIQSNTTLEIHILPSNKGKTMADYSRGRDQSQHKGGISCLYRFKEAKDDVQAGVGESSAALLVRRLG